MRCATRATRSELKKTDGRRTSAQPCTRTSHRGRCRRAGALSPLPVVYLVFG
eukprot:gene21586-biopygen17664